MHNIEILQQMGVTVWQLREGKSQWIADDSQLSSQEPDLERLVTVLQLQNQAGIPVGLFFAHAQLSADEVELFKKIASALSSSCDIAQLAFENVVFDCTLKFVVVFGELPDIYPRLNFSDKIPIISSPHLADLAQKVPLKKTLWAQLKSFKTYFN